MKNENYGFRNYAKLLKTSDKLLVYFMFPGVLAYLGESIESEKEIYY